jgi:hypothetical protein
MVIPLFLTLERVFTQNILKRIFTFTSSECLLLFSRKEKGKKKEYGLFTSAEVPWFSVLNRLLE